MHPPALLVILGCAWIGLSGCNVKKSDAGNAPVVAIVNNQAITASQLKQLLPSDSKPAAPDVTKRAIDSLVSEELLVQGAIKRRLDRDPAVVQAIDTARREVLARSFAERNLYPKSPITTGEIAEFYRGNPILFENRKRFQLKNFSISSMDMSDRLKADLDSVHSDTEVRELLERHNVKYSSQASAITADRLPIDKLGDFARANVGDLLIAQQGNGGTLLMFIAAIEDDHPMSLDRAKPYIGLYLANVRNGRSITDYLTQAKASSRINYPSTPGNPELQPTIPAALHDMGDAAHRPIRNDIVELDSIEKHATP